MSVDIQGLGMSLMTKIAGSNLADRLKIREPLQKFAYTSTRNGFEILEKFQQKRQHNHSKSSAQLFDISLTDEQSMIQDTIANFARDELRPMASEANENMAPPSNFFQQLSALGLNYFSVPESMGGAAQSYSPTTSCIIAENLSWGDFSLAYAALAPIAFANAINRWGNDRQKKWILPKFLQDEPITAAILVQENDPLFDPQLLKTQAKKTKHGYQITGEKSFVPFAGNADFYLIAAQYKQQPTLFIVDGKNSELKWQAAAAMGLRSTEMGNLTLNKVSVPHDAKITNQSFNYQAFIDSSHLHWCSLAIGTCQAALDYMIPYVNERQAFGEPISHRQSVAFLIANIAIELESMRLMTWRAAALAEVGKEFHREAYLAHAFCAEKAMEIGTNTVQLLGGHGFTKEHPGERWYRDLRSLACLSGGMHL